MKVNYNKKSEIDILEAIDLSTPNDIDTPWDEYYNSENEDNSSEGMPYWKDL